MNDGLIVLEAELSVDNPTVAMEFRKRNHERMGLACGSDDMPTTGGKPIRIFGWRAALAIHSLFDALSAERYGQPAGKNEPFRISYGELSRIGDACRRITDAYGISKSEGDRTGEMLAPPPLGMTVALSGYRYDFSSYRNEIERTADLIDLLRGVPFADSATYCYSFFLWL